MAVIAVTAGTVRQIGARVAIVIGAYVAAAVAILATVALLRSRIAPEILRDLLGYVFIATLAAGLEPGTVKAAAVSRNGVDAAEPRAYLTASTLKALLAAPLLALLWRFADPAVPASVLLSTPLIAVAGFGATDLRVLADLQGRHALAIGLKQGSLAGGVVLVGALASMNVPIAWAIAAASLARIGLLAPAALFLGGSCAPGGWWRDTHKLLADARWIELAAVSVIGAVSGSTDRFFGLRYLRPGDYGAYFLTYELLSKFWLIPYLLSPILFARQAAGQDAVRFARGAWGLTLTAGGLFVAAVAGAQHLAPDLLSRFTGADFGVATIAFAIAVAIGALGQLLLAQLQGSGRSRPAAIAVAIGAIISASLFLVAARTLGARGLLLAWLGKSLVELAALALAGRSPKTA
jgi:hypothetical protein